MRRPPRVPILFFNKDQERSDIRTTSYGEALDFPYRGTNRSEWGFLWERLDDTMGQPTDPPIPDWDRLADYRAPDPDAPGRYDHMASFVQQHGDRYLMGSLGISGFNLATFLRGFEDALTDLYLEPEKFEGILDMVLSFESRVIEHFADYGLDAVAFGDDWGTQQTLLVDPGLWREMFKPRYKRQFDLAHRKGLHVYFHCCGQIREIIPDLIDIGVDILNLNQPDIFGVESLGEEFAGRVCFNCPVDHQTVAINGDREQIFEYVGRLSRHLGSPDGGFIGYIEEYHSVGMSDENYRSIVEAFEALPVVSVG